MCTSIAMSTYMYVCIVYLYCCLFGLLTQIAWQQIEVVGDQSQYVSQVAAHLRTNIPIIRESLSSARKYFINFCHKFAK